jgi:prephenate dehydrogenase
VSTVTIVGVGLIGGSFALALRKAGFRGKILGVSSPGTISKALELRVIDDGHTLVQAAQQSDVLYLAQPISQILTTLDALQELARPDALVTDAGSTKSVIAARATGLRATFVGGHPMAGKESRGVEAADADLFRGRPYIVTSPHSWLMEWIPKIGARPIVMSAEDHDRLIAAASHVPQLVSTALASFIGDRGADKVAGPGAVDMTRLALSSYDIWRDILSTNTAAVADSLDAYIARLQELRAKIVQSGMSEEFAKGAAAAKAIRGE